MNGILIHKFGEHGTLGPLPLESPGPGELLVTVHTAAVNPFDWKVRDGLGGKRPMPFVLGQDFAGVVTQVGKDTTGFAVGDRIFGIAGQHGSYAQVTVVATDGKHNTILGRIPAGVTDAVAAALVTPGITGLASVAALNVAGGDTIVIHGATGGVGCIAAQVARDKGIKIIASVRGSSADARALGVAAVVDTAVTDLIEGIRQAQPDGVEAVLDLVSTNHDDVQRFTEVLRPGGTIVSTNFAADVEALKRGGFSAVNLSSLDTPQATGASLEDLAMMVAAGTLLVRVARELPYEDAADVLDVVKAGELPGKTVLRVARAAP